MFYQQYYQAPTEENHHFCHKWLFICLKSVVHISTGFTRAVCDDIFFASAYAE